MKAILVLLGMIFLGALATNTLAGPTTSVSETDRGLTINTPDGILTLEVWSDRIVHVRFAATDEAQKSPSLVAIGEPDKTQWTHKHTDTGETLSTSQFTAKIDARTGALSFTDSSGKTFLAETSKDARKLKPLRQAFKLTDEAIYGLGQHQNGLINYRGTTVHLQQANMDVAVPMLISSNGYGILWDNASVTDVAVADPTFQDKLSIQSEAGDAIDYYFLAGPNLDDVIASYRKLTGAAPMMARWTWGLWQSKERYKSQEELLDIAARYRKMKVPIDGIVQDWQYWPADQWGSHEFDSERYPDPNAMMQKLHDEHFHAIISVWPKFDLKTKNTDELEKAGGMYPTTFPSVYPKAQNRWYDPFKASARLIYWQQISKSLATVGFDGWWLDASEAELGGDWGEMRTLTTAIGPGAGVYNAYPLMHTTGVYEGSRKDKPEKRAFILTRSAYAGQQRNAAVTWSGDIRGNWEVFRRQIPAGLNFSASGIPYWNTDIGGFFGGKPSDPEYAELFTRWYQFGAFCPMFRVHGTGAGKEIWQFDEPTQKILLKYDKLRYRLLPYIYSTSWRVANEGYTMMRPLVMDFRTDKLAWNVADQYMFGPSIMVSPVVQPRATARNVWLPGKEPWYDFWTGKQHGAGKTLDAAAPIETMPLFVRAGSIIPMGPVVQYADEDPNGAIELRVYRGADASFNFYEDEGDNYNYESGKRSVIPIKWNEAKHTLTFGDRQGEYPGMPKTRTFAIVWVGDGVGAGVDKVGIPMATEFYKGTAEMIEGPQ
jgi:alpha-D-xyloside xylohydrolase